MMTQTEIKKKSESFKKWYQAVELLPDFWTCPRDPKKTDFVLSILRICNHQRVLDIGCSSGLFALAAGRSGAIDVLGIDKSKQAIEQANFVMEVWLGLGYPVKNVSFWNVDIQKHLGTFADRDLLIACNVFYDLGQNVHKLMEAVGKSPVHTMIMQGDLNREVRITNSGQDWGDNLCNLEGMGRLASKHGWKFREVLGNKYPVVIATKL